jgi:Fis family transcriptional regulator, factor for inversion stimulation protein
MLTQRTPLKQNIDNIISTYLNDLSGAYPNQLFHKIITSTEISLLKSVLERVSWNQSQASSLLGISRNTLRKKISEYNLQKKT